MHHLIPALAREHAADLRRTAHTSNLASLRHATAAGKGEVPSCARARIYQTARLWLMIRRQPASTSKLPHFIDSQSRL